MLYREAGQFKTTYAAEQQLFPIRQDRIGMAILLRGRLVGVPLASATPAIAGAIDFNYLVQRRVDSVPHLPSLARSLVFIIGIPTTSAATSMVAAPPSRPVPMSCAPCSSRQRHELTIASTRR